MVTPQVAPSRLRAGRVYSSLAVPTFHSTQRKKMSSIDFDEPVVPIKDAFRRRLDHRKASKAVLSPDHSDSLTCTLVWKAARCLSTETRVFTVSGEYPDIVEALQRRGWVQNQDEDSPACDFTWRRAAKPPTFLSSCHYFNHFRTIYHISTKVFFTEHLRELQELCGVHSDLFYPRAHQVRLDSGFERDFKCTFALSLISRFVQGEILHPARVRAALIVAKAGQASETHWKLMKATTETTIARTCELSRISPDCEVGTLSKEAKAVLDSQREINPQFHMNGDCNLWIIKPGRKSRGRDIFVSNSLEKIRSKCSLNQSWIAQKYIETPLLILKRKFDIRQWVLVTAFQPLTVWMFGECYLRFAAVDYTSDNLDDLFIHLTNNSICKHSDGFDSGPIPELMWHCSQFQDLLIAQHHSDVWTDSILPAMQDIIIRSLQSVNPHVRKRTKSFELLGFDLMIDERLKPWLLEVNVSPAMDYSTRVTERMVKDVLEDTIKVVVDLQTDASAATGKFRRIYG